MKILKSILIIFISASCNQDKNSGFSLTGTTSELKNGTVLYLCDPSKEEIIDSVQVQKNSFNLTTNLKSDPLLAVLKNKNGSLRKKFWIENKPMSLNASIHTFENAEISGSDIQTLYSDLYEAIDTLARKEGEELLGDFIKTNRNNILGAFVLSEYYVSWKKEKTEPLYQQLSKKNKNSLYGKKILKYLELNKNPTIGQKYVDFELANQYGEPIKLSDIKGKLVLLEFWASWCAPCRKDNKELVVYYNKYRTLGFEIFHVSLDDDNEEWINAIRQDNLQWTNVSDLKLWNNEAAMIYGINLLPSNFLIDRDGIIINRNLRGPNLEQKIKEMLE